MTLQTTITYYKSIFTHYKSTSNTICKNMLEIYRL